MATFGEIKAEVTRIVEDRIAVLDAAIVTHVSRAQKAIESRCAFFVQRAAVTYQVQPNATSYAKPADFLGVREKPYYLEVLTSKQYTLLTELYSFESLGLLTTQGVPRYWRDADESNFEFWPIGDALGPSVVTSGSYDLVVPYFKSLSALAADSDMNWWSLNMSDVLAWRAVSFLFAEMRDPMANWWSTLAGARFREIHNQDRRNRLRQRETRIYPSEALSAGTQSTRRWLRRNWIAHIP